MVNRNLKYGGLHLTLSESCQACMFSARQRNIYCLLQIRVNKAFVINYKTPPPFATRRGRPFSKYLANSLFLHLQGLLPTMTNRRPSMFHETHFTYL